MAAAPLTLGEQIQEELTCSICLELFTKPKILPCLHTFCQDCLKDVAGNQEHLYCPTCRQQAKLPCEGVAGLRNNHLVVSLCERLQNQARLSEETVENKCNQHPSDEVKLHCKQCNTPVCTECLDEMHSTHVIMTLKKAVQERRSQIEALISELYSILDSCNSLVCTYKETIKSLKVQQSQTRSSIIQAYDNVVQKLAENRDLLLSKADKDFEKNTDILREETARVETDMLELSGASQHIVLALEQGGINLLSQETISTEILRKYRGKAAPALVQIQPAVFQPAGIPVPVLGHVTTQSLPAAPTVEVTEEGVLESHHQAEIPVITFIWEGSGKGQRKSSSGITVSDGEEIFVADYENQMVQIFPLQDTCVREFPTVVSRSYSLFFFLSGELTMDPNDLAFDGQGNLWVVGSTDSAEFAVQYNKQGNVLRKFDLQKTGWLRGVAVDTRRNRILITQTTGDEESPHGEVLVFSPDGTLVRTVGWQQGMKSPQFLTVDGKGSILVSDFGSHCVFVYSEDGNFLFQFGGHGHNDGQLSDPRGICADRAGNIIVADSGNNRVEMFDKTGRFLKHMATDMKDPHAVAMAPQGQLVVTRHR